MRYRRKLLETQAAERNRLLKVMETERALRRGTLRPEPAE
jgi:hypothetical protein